MASGPFSANWFDLLLMTVLIVGIVIGRKRGMSEELLDVVQWLAMVFVAALLYRPVGDFLAGYTHMSPLWTYIGTYLFFLILLKLLFSWIKKMVGEKLIGSDVFGRLEYYLGMLAGGLRFACILLAVLAIVHARTSTPEELAAQAKMQKDNFGDISFPTFGSIQQDIFLSSFTGPYIERYLGSQLISTAPVAPKTREPLARKRERAVDEALGQRK